MASGSPFLMDLEFSFDDDRYHYFGFQMAICDLDQYTHQKMLTKEQILWLAAQIVMGLKYMHQVCLMQCTFYLALKL